MNEKLPSELGCKKEVLKRWKWQWATQEKYRLYRYGVRKDKTLLQLKVARDMMVNKMLPVIPWQKKRKEMKR